MLPENVAARKAGGTENLNISDVIPGLFAIIQARAANPAENSYTNYLLEKGLDKICKKVGEEAAEVIIAAKNNSPAELTAEIVDLTYHLLVLMHACGICPEDIAGELNSRER